MWLVIDNNTQRVKAIEETKPPDSAYGNSYLVEWDRPIPALESIDTNGNIIPADLDPTLGWTIGQWQAWAIETINSQAREQDRLWQSAYVGYGDFLAVLQAIEVALNSTRQAAIEAVNLAMTKAEIDTILVGLTWPPVPNQATIEVDVGSSLIAKEEAKQFLIDFPNAKQLIELDYADLITAIQNRTAGQETLLLMTLAFSVRYLKELIR